MFAGNTQRQATKPDSPALQVTNPRGRKASYFGHARVAQHPAQKRVEDWNKQDCLTAIGEVFSRHTQLAPHEYDQATTIKLYQNPSDYFLDMLRVETRMYNATRGVFRQGEIEGLASLSPFAARLAGKVYEHQQLGTATKEDVDREFAEVDRQLPTTQERTLVRHLLNRVYTKIAWTHNGQVHAIGRIGGAALLHELLHGLSNPGLIGAAFSEGICEFFVGLVIKQATGRAHLPQAYVANVEFVASLIDKFDCFEAVCDAFFTRNQQCLQDRLGDRWFPLISHVSTNQWDIAMMLLEPDWKTNPDIPAETRSSDFGRLFGQNLNFLNATYADLSATSRKAYDMRDQPYPSRNGPVSPYR